MKKRIILLTLSLLLIVGMLGARNAYAWFNSMHGGSQNVNGIKSGVIDYSLGSGAFIIPTDGDIYPEQNLLTGAIQLRNNSDISTNVRVKITYTYAGNTYVWNPDANATGALRVELASNNWKYNATDQYLYYKNGNNQEIAIAGKVEATSGSGGSAAESVPLFTSVCFSGPNTANANFAGQDVTITVYYEARQSQYLTSWNYASELAAWNS